MSSKRDSDCIFNDDILHVVIILRRARLFRSTPPIIIPVICEDGCWHVNALNVRSLNYLHKSQMYQGGVFYFSTWCIWNHTTGNTCHSRPITRFLCQQHGVKPVTNWFPFCSWRVSPCFSLIDWLPFLKGGGYLLALKMKQFAPSVANCTLQYSSVLSSNFSPNQTVTVQLQMKEAAGCHMRMCQPSTTLWSLFESWKACQNTSDDGYGEMRLSSNIIAECFSGNTCLKSQLNGGSRYACWAQNWLRQQLWSIPWQIHFEHAELSLGTRVVMDISKPSLLTSLPGMFCSRKHLLLWGVHAEISAQWLITISCEDTYPHIPQELVHRSVVACPNATIQDFFSLFWEPSFFDHLPVRCHLMKKPHWAGVINV